MDPGTVDLVKRALALKDQPRKGWLRAGLERPESVADHSWGVAFLAVLAAESRPDLDRARILELAILHDVAEAATGDLVPGDYQDRAEKLGLEREALDLMLEWAPLAVRTRLFARFEEYATGASDEALLVRDLDKLEMAFQAERYATLGVAPERLSEFHDSAKKGIRDARLRGTAETLG